MNKKQLIELSDCIRKFNAAPPITAFTYAQISALADFCESQNPLFKRARWFEYIAGACGPSGGAK